MGINVKRMILLSFALSAAIGAVAGIVVTPISLMEYDRGAMLAVKGFGAAVPLSLAASMTPGLLLSRSKALSPKACWAALRDS